MKNKKNLFLLVSLFLFSFFVLNIPTTTKLYAENLYSSLDLVPFNGKISNKDVVGTSFSTTTTILFDSSISTATNLSYNQTLYKSGESLSNFYYVRLYYIDELFLDSYSGYYLDNDFVNSIDKIYLPTFSTAYGNSGTGDFAITFNCDLAVLLSDWIPQHISIDIYLFNSDMLSIKNIWSIGSYSAYNHYDLDSYNVGYDAGYKDGVNDTMLSIGEASQGSYDSGYIDGYNVGYNYCLAVGVLSNINYIKDYDLYIQKIDNVTDGVNNLDVTSSLYFVGVDIELSSNFDLNLIDSISLNLHPTPLFDDSYYDGSNYDASIFYYNSDYRSDVYAYGVNYDNLDLNFNSDVACFNFSNYGTLYSGGSYINGSISDLDFSNIVFSNGNICNNADDFMEYNFRTLFKDYYSGVSSDYNHINFTFVYCSNLIDFDYITNLFDNITLSIELTDNTLHDVNSIQFLSSLFTSNNAYLNFDAGYKFGYKRGYDDGHIVGLSNSTMLRDTIFSILDAPFHMIKYVLNFNFLGVNLWQIFTGIISICLLVFVIKKFF